MSCIHCPYGNYYELSESLKYLFDDLVIQPFVQELPALAEDVRNIRPDYWNDIARILKQGQSNFDSPSFDELSNKWYFPKDKVLVFIKILQISMFISVFLVFVHENAR